MQKIKMSIEYVFNPQDFQSIKNYCLLRSLVNIPEGVEDKKLKDEREAYRILSHNFQNGYFDKKHQRNSWFYTVYKHLGYPQTNEHFYNVYTEIEKLLNSIEE